MVFLQKCRLSRSGKLLQRKKLKKASTHPDLGITLPIVKTRPFAHLHLHTGYSLLDGATRIPDIMDYALETGMPAAAITDHGVMYGIIDFYQQAKKKGVKPILGCECYITADRHSRGESGRMPINHLVLLAESDEGYANLVRLVSHAHLEGFYYKPRIDRELLKQYSKGLIGLSACLQGEVAQRITGNDIEAAKTAVMDYSEIFGKNNFFLEIQDHGIPEQRKVNKILKDVTASTGVPLVATNDVHYLKKEHAEAHEVLLCLQTQAVMSDPNRMRYSTHEFYMKSGKEMEAIFKDFPGSIDLTLEIADRCNAEIEFGKLHFPTFHLPKGTEQKDYLKQLSYEGMKHRYGLKDPKKPKNDKEKEILARFEHEISVIDKAGFINYFLVVWDFVHFAHKQGIPVGPGRGSGGGSVVAYLLGITSIDPLRYSLIFERFLNPERVSPPDFDIDFCQARRGEVIQYVKEKYGREQCAQIVTFGTLGSKTVIRDIGRVLELPYSYCDRLSKMIPDDPKIKLEDALKNSPEFKKAYETENDCKRILEYGFVLEGLQRNQGTHAAGVVIGEKPLTEIIPLCRDKDDEPVTQYTMEPLGEIGLLKMDFLGLKTLTVLQEAVDLVKATTGKEIDLDTIEFDDEPTYELLNRGDTIGVFQLESGGMRDLIRRVRIDRIEDLIAMIALYRPGPMNMLEGFINRKHGKEEIAYQHPLMEEILKETYGVMVYQEQVQKVANVLAGYSLGEADILRRAMGKKKAEVMAQQKGKFVDGCMTTNKIDKKLASDIFDNMAEFAGYGFNKSHSAGYAIISYQTAFMKANFPAQFMAALISSEIGNSDKLPVFIAEAQAMELEILPPDINHSYVRFMPKDKTIRYGMAGIKNVGAGACEAIVKEREANGAFADLTEFCERIDGQLVNKKVIESLARCGGFDSTGMHRAKVFNGLEFAMARASEKARDKQSGQGSLFDLMDSSDDKSVAEALPECEPWSENQLLSAEKELLGIYMSGHPLTQYEYLLEHYQLCAVKNLSTLTDRSTTRVGGIIASLDRKLTKQKKPMAIIRLEDLDGFVEVLVWPEAYEKFGMHLSPEAAVLICGEALTSDDTPKIAAQEIYPLRDAPRHFAKQLRVHVPASHTQNGELDKLKEILRMHPGSTPVVVCLLMPAGEKVFINTNKSFRVFPDESLIKEVEHLLGEEAVYVTVEQTACKNPPQKKRWEKKTDNGD